MQIRKVENFRPPGGLYAQGVTGMIAEMFQLAVKGQLSVNIQEEPLENIEEIWSQDLEAGKRLVVTMTKIRGLRA